MTINRREFLRLMGVVSVVGNVLSRDDTVERNPDVPNEIKRRFRELGKGFEGIANKVRVETVLIGSGEDADDGD